MKELDPKISDALHASEEFAELHQVNKFEKVISSLTIAAGLSFTGVLLYLTVASSSFYAIVLPGAILLDGIIVGTVLQRFNEAREAKKGHELITSIIRRR